MGAIKLKRTPQTFFSFIAILMTENYDRCRPSQNNKIFIRGVYGLKVMRSQTQIIIPKIIYKTTQLLETIFIHLKLNTLAQIKIYLVLLRLEN